MSGTNTQNSASSDPMPDLNAQTAPGAPKVSSTNPQLPGQLPWQGTPSVAMARTPTLPELITAHTRLSTHLTNLVHFSLKDLQVDARALTTALHRPIKAVSKSSSSFHAPVSDSIHPNHIDVSKVASPNQPIPELIALLKRHAKYTKDVVGTLQDLNEISWFIGTTGFFLDEGSTPPLPTPIGLAPSPAATPPSTSQGLAGSSVPIPASRPLAPLPSFPPSAAVFTKSLPPAALATRTNGAPSPLSPAPSPRVTSVAAKLSPSTPVPTEAETVPRGNLLFAPNPSASPAPAAVTASIIPLPLDRDRTGASALVSTGTNPYVPQAARITQNHSPGTGGVTGHPPPSEAKKPCTIPDLFPLLEAPLLSAIIRHDLPPTELWQLDTRASATDRNATLSLPTPSISTAGPSASVYRIQLLQRFPTLNSLLIPLTTYFRILHAALASTLTAAFSPIVFLNSFSDPNAPANPTGPDTLRVACDATQAYVAHLLDLDERYEWDAVLAYHLAFHERRRVEMAIACGSGAGSCGAEGYNGWGVADGELIALYLFGREKNPTRGVTKCMVAGTRTSNGVTAGVAADSKAMVGGEGLRAAPNTSIGADTSRITGSERVKVKVKAKAKSGGSGKRRH